MGNDMEEQISSDDVDVQQLMADVRAEVERKRSAGLYPPDVLEEFDALTGSESSEDSLSSAMMSLRQSSGFSTAVTTASKMGPVAPLASSFKRVIRGSVRWYMTGILQQVEQFSANAIHVIGLLANRVRRLEELNEEMARQLENQTAQVRASIETAARATEATERRLNELESVRAGDRLPSLERSLRGIREAMDGPAEPPAAAAQAAQTARSTTADRSLDYYDFESCFRGDEADVKRKQEVYVEVFRDVPAPVVDLGCGRGEFLELLVAENIPAYGIDRHPDMIERCVEKGLDARRGDVLDHLSSVPQGTLGGVFSAQMIEHLDVGDVPRFFELAADALAPGGRLVVETLNPQSLYVFAAAFYVDLGHLRPLHPLTLRFLAEKSGFSDVRVEYQFPAPDDVRPLEVRTVGDPKVDEALGVVNENFARFDRVVFGPQDYAIVATR